MAVLGHSSFCFVFFISKACSGVVKRFNGTSNATAMHLDLERQASERK